MKSIEKKTVVIPEISIFDDKKTDYLNYSLNINNPLDTNYEKISYYVIKDEFSNQRVGNAKVKRRSDVRGGGRKPYKQKGTGNARQGSIRAPQYPGGGKAFGPNGRCYTKKINRKLVNKFINILLLKKIENGEIIILNNNCTKTKYSVNKINNLCNENKKKCFVFNKEYQIRSIRNISKEKNKFVVYDKVLCRDILFSKFVLFLSKEVFEKFISRFILI